MRFLSERQLKPNHYMLFMRFNLRAIKNHFPNQCYTTLTWWKHFSLTVPQILNGLKVIFSVKKAKIIMRTEFCNWFNAKFMPKSSFFHSKCHTLSKLSFVMPLIAPSVDPHWNFFFQCHVVSLFFKLLVGWLKGVRPIISLGT